MKRWLMLSMLAWPTVLMAEIQPGTDPLAYPGGAWSPYVVGAGIGVLSWLTFLLCDKAIGASSFFATVAGFVGQVLAPRFTLSLKYFKEHPPRVDWSLVFVSFAIAGAALAAWQGGEFMNAWLHPMWIARFGDSLVLRAAMAIAGGIFMGFGARLGGGCTSGHGISGTLQLNVASWIAVAFMFIGGIATAMLLYRL